MKIREFFTLLTVAKTFKMFRSPFVAILREMFVRRVNYKHNQIEQMSQFAFNKLCRSNHLTPSNIKITADSHNTMKAAISNALSL
jgi:D-ribose pyranose/furanose isomerase RbsD